MSAAPLQSGYTRAELAAGIDAAHDALHASPPVDAAHEALHAVGGGSQRVGCATRDMETQAILRDLHESWQRPIPCGHTVGDLIGGPGVVTKCGACLLAKQSPIPAPPSVDGDTV